MLNGKRGGLKKNHTLPNVDRKIQRGAIKEVLSAEKVLISAWSLNQQTTILRLEVRGVPKGALRTHSA